MTPKVQAAKAKIDKWDYIKLLKLLHSKGNSQQNEKLTHGMGENICKHVSVMGLTSKIYKGLLQLSNKNNPPD